MGNLPPLPDMVPIPMCPYDGCPVNICGGPHYVVLTDLGEEVLKEGQEPLGTPK